MSQYALVVRTEQGEEHISNPLENIGTPAQAKELLDLITQGDVEWVGFDAGVRFIAVPIDVVTYIAIAPYVDEVIGSPVQMQPFDPAAINDALHVEDEQ